MKKNIAQTVEELIKPTADEFGYLLWDVEYLREGADMILRVTIDTDRDGGITIEDCEKLHRAIDPMLDEADPIEESYYLEVTSPGVERTLSKEEHFVRMAGFDVILKFFTPVDGTKSVRGTLVGLDGDEIVITVGDDEKRYAKKAVAKCETVFEW